MTTMQQQDPATLRLVAGRAKAAELQPYLNTALFAMKPVRETRIDTLGVDPQWRMYWNPDFIATLSVDECAGAWLHEVGHLLRTHRARFEALLEPQNRHPLWNKAGDAAINADLREAGVPLPAIKAVYPEHIPGGQPGMTTEQFYRLILDTPEAEKVATQREDVLLLPNLLIVGKTDGQRIIGITRAGFLDNNDFTVTVTDADENPVALRDAHVHDRRTIGFVIDAEIPAGGYIVTITSGDTTVTTVLPVMAPSIRLRPDHIVSGWAAPYKVTVVGQFTEFTANAVVSMRDSDGNEVAVTPATCVSKTYLTFEIAEQVADGTYVVAVNDGTTTTTAALPIGLPFMDISPNALPVGHGTPYPFAAVVDDFTFDATTTFDVFLPIMGVLVEIPNALSSIIIKTPTTADFTLAVSLAEGEYLVVATTGDERAVSTLSVSNASVSGEGEGDGSGEGAGGGSGEGEGDGDGEGEGDGSDESGEGDGEGSGSGSGSQSGDGDGGFSDCGSGSGGGPRPWDRGGDTSDGSIDEGRGNLIREQVARDIQNHAKTRGTVPGGWGRWADSILKPQVDWRKELRSVVRRTCATVAGMRDYTYQRPSRRAGSVSGIVLPALRAPRPPRAAAVVDTSGSVSDRMLGQAIGDMTALLKQIQAGGGDALSLIACDAAAAEMKSVRTMKNLTSLEGGGGTDMRVGIEAAAAITPKVDIIITFTDGETPWPEAPPLANPRAKYVAVLLAGDTEGRHWSVPDWMHKIVVDDAYLRGDRR